MLRAPAAGKSAAEAGAHLVREDHDEKRRHRELHAVRPGTEAVRVDYIGCTSKGDDVPFSIEAHGKEGEPPPETLMKIRSCKVEPKGERIYGRMDGKIVVDTDGSVAKPE